MKTMSDVEWWPLVEKHNGNLSYQKGSFYEVSFPTWEICGDFMREFVGMVTTFKDQWNMLDSVVVNRVFLYPED